MTRRVAEEGFLVRVRDIRAEEVHDWHVGNDALLKHLNDFEIAE